MCSPASSSPAMRGMASTLVETTIIYTKKNMKLHLLELELRAKDISRRWQECTRATESSQISGKKLVTIDGKIWKILDSVQGEIDNQLF